MPKSQGIINTTIPVVSSLNILQNLNVNGTTTVTDIYASGTADIVGNTTVTNIYASGTADIVGDTTVTNIYASGTADIVGDTTVTNISASGTANVTGLLTATDISAVGNTDITGLLTVTGNGTTQGVIQANSTGGQGSIAMSISDTTTLQSMDIIVNDSASIHNPIIPNGATVCLNTPQTGTNAGIPMILANRSSISSGLSINDSSILMGCGGSGLVPTNRLVIDSTNTSTPVIFDSVNPPISLATIPTNSNDNTLATTEWVQVLAATISGEVTNNFAALNGNNVFTGQNTFNSQASSTIPQFIINSNDTGYVTSNGYIFVATDLTTTYNPMITAGDIAIVGGSSAISSRALTLSPYSTTVNSGLRLTSSSSVLKASTGIYLNSPTLYLQGNTVHLGSSGFTTFTQSGVAFTLSNANANSTITFQTQAATQAVTNLTMSSVNSTFKIPVVIDTANKLFLNDAATTSTNTSIYQSSGNLNISNNNSAGGNIVLSSYVSSVSTTLFTLNGTTGGTFGVAISAKSALNISESITAYSNNYNSFVTIGISCTGGNWNSTGIQAGDPYILGGLSAGNSILTLTVWGLGTTATTTASIRLANDTTTLNGNNFTINTVNPPTLTAVVAVTNIGQAVATTQFVNDYIVGKGYALLTVSAAQTMSGQNIFTTNTTLGTNIPPLVIKTANTTYPNNSGCILVASDNTYNPMITAGDIAIVGGSTTINNGALTLTTYSATNSGLRLTSASSVLQASTGIYLNSPTLYLQGNTVHLGSSGFTTFTQSGVAFTLSNANANSTITFQTQAATQAVTNLTMSSVNSTFKIPVVIDTANKLFLNDAATTSTNTSIYQSSGNLNISNNNSAGGNIVLSSYVSSVSTTLFTLNGTSGTFNVPISAKSALGGIQSITAISSNYNSFATLGIATSTGAWGSGGIQEGDPYLLGGLTAAGSTLAITVWNNNTNTAGIRLANDTTTMVGNYLNINTINPPTLSATVAVTNIGQAVATTQFVQDYIAANPVTVTGAAMLAANNPFTGQNTFSSASSSTPPVIIKTSTSYSTNPACWLMVATDNTYNPMIIAGDSAIIGGATLTNNGILTLAPYASNAVGLRFTSTTATLQAPTQITITSSSVQINGTLDVSSGINITGTNCILNTSNPPTTTATMPAITDISTTIPTTTWVQSLLSSYISPTFNATWDMMSTSSPSTNPSYIAQIYFTNNNQSITTGWGNNGYFIMNISMVFNQTSTGGVPSTAMVSWTSRVMVYPARCPAKSAYTAVASGTNTQVPPLWDGSIWNAVQTTPAYSQKVSIPASNPYAPYDRWYWPISQTVTYAPGSNPTSTLSNAYPICYYTTSTVNKNCFGVAITPPVTSSTSIFGTLKITVENSYPGTNPLYISYTAGPVQFASVTAYGWSGTI